MSRPASRSVRPDGPRRYGLLLVSTLLALGVQGVAPSGRLQEVAVSFLAGASLLLAVHAARLPRSLVRAAAALAIVALALAIVRATSGNVGDGTFRAINAALVAFGPPAVAIGVVRELRATGRVGVEAVMGVLSLYILIGMLFAFLYGAIDRFGDTPFFVAGASATVSHCLYFSFTTLTTVGYGDFAAATDLGRTLAVFEALLGQIYLVTVVSLIVGNLGRRAGPEGRIAPDG